MPGSHRHWGMDATRPVIIAAGTISHNGAPVTQLESILEFQSLTFHRMADTTEVPVFGSGGSMAKSFFILMLVAAQLLTGSGGSVYLCIGSDGSFCCVDSGPGSCTCCHEHADESQVACRSQECENADDRCAESCCEHQHADLPSDNGREERHVDDPCGCIHVAVMVPAGQPTSVARSSSASDRERLVQIVAGLPAECSAYEVSASPVLSSPSSGPPAVPDFHLTVVSTVILRC